MNLVGSNVDNQGAAKASDVEDVNLAVFNDTSQAFFPTKAFEW